MDQPRSRQRYWVLLLELTVVADQLCVDAPFAISISQCVFCNGECCTDMIGRGQPRAASFPVPPLNELTLCAGRVGSHRCGEITHPVSVARRSNPLRKITRPGACAFFII